MISALREKTGAGLLDVKKALDEAKGNTDEAITILRKKLGNKMDKLASRATKEGLIESYIHLGGKVGVLVEVNCETDFVAKTDDFKRLVKDIALHIASPSAPRFLAREEVPQAELDQERHIAEVQAKESGKPDNIVDTIVEGKLNAYMKDIVLLEQPYVKDDSKTVQQLLDETSAKVGERIAVRRFTRFKLGEGAQEDASGTDES